MNRGGAGIPNDADLVLELWLAAPEDSAQERELLQVLMRHAENRIRVVIRTKLAFAGYRGFSNGEIDDACQTAQLNLLRFLRAYRQDGSSRRLQKFLPYVSKIARNTCHEIIRQRNPAWVSMASKVQYRAKHWPEFALWEDSDGQDVCGFRRDVGCKARYDRKKIDTAMEQLRLRQDLSRTPVDELMRQTLTAAGAPLPLDALIDVVVEYAGLKDFRERSLAEEISPGIELSDTLKDPGRRPEQQVEDVELMRWLWAEISDLAPEHRSVVVLNLRAAVDSSIELFELLGIASRSQFAGILGLDPEGFAKLSMELPLDDAHIARLLKLTPAQVSDRRRSAKNRLQRRYGQPVVRNK